MLKNDKWIRESNIIHPFNGKLTRKNEKGYKEISHGLGSYGYDISISEKEVQVFKRKNKEDFVVLDPKNFSFDNLRRLDPILDYYDMGEGRYFILDAGESCLAVSKEYFEIPKNVTALCLGKSTYARCQIIVNVTPLEAGWKGYLTLEIINANCIPVKIYLEEGIAQLLFLEGEECEVDYESRKGKYQDQHRGL